MYDVLKAALIFCLSVSERKLGIPLMSDICEPCYACTCLCISKLGFLVTIFHELENHLLWAMGERKPEQFFIFSQEVSLQAAVNRQ